MSNTECQIEFSYITHAKDCVGQECNKIIVGMSGSRLENLAPDLPLITTFPSFPSLHTFPPAFWLKFHFFLVKNKVLHLFLMKRCLIVIFVFRKSAYSLSWFGHLHIKLPGFAAKWYVPSLLDRCFVLCHKCILLLSSLPLV